MNAMYSSASESEPAPGTTLEGARESFDDGPQRLLEIRARHVRSAAVPLFDRRRASPAFFPLVDIEEEACEHDHSSRLVPFGRGADRVDLAPPPSRDRTLNSTSFRSVSTSTNVRKDLRTPSRSSGCIRAWASAIISNSEGISGVENPMISAPRRLIVPSIRSRAIWSEPGTGGLDHVVELSPTPAKVVDIPGQLLFGRPVPGSVLPENEGAGECAVLPDRGGRGEDEERPAVRDGDRERTSITSPPASAMLTGSSAGASSVPSGRRGVKIETASAAEQPAEPRPARAPARSFTASIVPSGP